MYGTSFSLSNCGKNIPVLRARVNSILLFFPLCKFSLAVLTSLSQIVGIIYVHKEKRTLQAKFKKWCKDVLQFCQDSFFLWGKDGRCERKYNSRHLSSLKGTTCRAAIIDGIQCKRRDSFICYVTLWSIRVGIWDGACGDGCLWKERRMFMFEWCVDRCQLGLSDDGYWWMHTQYKEGIICFSCCAN